VSLSVDSQNICLVSHPTGQTNTVSGDVHLQCDWQCGLRHWLTTWTSYGI